MKKIITISILLFLIVLLIVSLTGCSTNELELVKEENVKLTEEVKKLEESNKDLTNQIEILGKEKETSQNIAARESKMEEKEDKINERAIENLFIISNMTTNANLKDTSKANFIENLYGKWVNDKSEYLIFDKDKISVGWEGDTFFLLYSYEIIEVNVEENYIILIIMLKYPEDDSPPDRIFNLDKVVFTEDNKIEYLSRYNDEDSWVTNWVRE